MLKFAGETTFLLLAACLAFLWTSNPNLSYYTLQVVAFFILILLLNQILAKKKGTASNWNVDAIVFTLIVFLLIGSTGGLNSPLFFLVYFLMFGLALLFEPLITLSLSITLVILFLLTYTEQNFLAELVQLLSILLVTPLALFFSKQYLNLLKDEEKIKILEEEENLLDNTITNEETDMLLWETLEFKKTLVYLLDQISLLLTDVSHLPVRQKEGLLNIRNRLMELLKSGETIKKDVDEIDGD